MADDPLVETHKALFTVLDYGLDIPVYDDVPENAQYPYVEIVRHFVSPIDNLNSRKDEFFTYLSVWSQYKGQKEVLEIMAMIYDLLHQVQLPMEAGRMVRCYVDSRDTARDTDKRTFTGNVKIRTLVEH